MRSRIPSSGVTTPVFLVLLALATLAAASEQRYRGPLLTVDYDGPLLIDNSRFLYPSVDKLAFRTQRYLELRAGNLLAVRPAIDTWAAHFGVHPEVLSQVALAYFGKQPVADAPAHAETILDLAAGLAEVFEPRADQPLAATQAVAAVASAYGFPLDLPGELARPIEVPVQRGSGPPLFGYFAPPWEPGAIWSGGGVHGGSGENDRNALDFWDNYTGWGGDTSNYWVAAAQAGIARVWSSCNVSVVHPNGWETGYYHLDNVQVTDMQEVQAGTRLANYADNVDQATCEGGSSSGPHVHFTIRYNGSRVLNDESNVDFTSWRHHAGVGSYDFDCATSYYTLANSAKVCPSSDQLPNNAPTPLIFSNGFESGGTSSWTSALPLAHSARTATEDRDRPFRSP